MGFAGFLGFLVDGIESIAFYGYVPSGLYAVLFAVGAAMFVLVVLLLRRAYRLQPPILTGRWQLTLLDLIVISIIIGLAFTFWLLNVDLNGAQPLAAVRGCIEFALCVIVCMLVASRIGYPTVTMRAHYALSLMLRYWALTFIFLLFAMNIMFLAEPMTLLGLNYDLSSKLRAILDTDTKAVINPLLWWLAGLFLRWRAHRRLARYRQMHFQPQLILDKGNVQ